MPPPLLSRQLRPCHSSWSCRAARCASTAAAPNAISSDDTPYSRTAGWWDAVRRCGFSSTQVIDAPATSAATSPSPQPVRSTPAQQVNARLRGFRSANATRATVSAVEDKTTNDTKLTITKFASVKGSRRPDEPWRQRSLTRILPDANRHDLQGTEPEGLPSEADRGVDGSLEAHIGKDDGPSLQEQLQILVRKVEALQQKLSASTIKNNDELVSTSQSGLESSAIHLASQASADTSQKTEHESVQITRIVDRATKVHSTVTRLLMRLVVVLENQSSQPAARLASLARNRLETSARLAFAAGDHYILWALASHEGGRFKHLYSDRPTVAYVSAEFGDIVRSLSQAARDLEQMLNQSVQPIALMMRARLHQLSIEAQKENDHQLLRLLSRCRPWVPPLRYRDGIQHDGADKGGSTDDDVHSHVARAPDISRSDSASARAITEPTVLSSPVPDGMVPGAMKGLRQQQGPYSASKSTTGRTIVKENSPVPSFLDAHDTNNQTLLDELFPEPNSPPPPQTDTREQYQKLDLPQPDSIIRLEPHTAPKTLQEQIVDSFRSKGEDITVLQLENCSTELTESDFRCLIPKGQHIESWNRDGEFYKVIPGRDPLSLERLPMYFLLFRSSAAAYAYQKNASRLHKLAALHQTSSIYSAVPPPRGFLEQGEDVSAATTSYLLAPTEHPLPLRTLMQPYRPALRALLEAGGYRPIVSGRGHESQQAWKVLLFIEGYEPSQSDLYRILLHHSYKRGSNLGLLDESASSIRRLRDLINLRSRVSSVSLNNPQADGASRPAVTKMHFEDAQIEEIWGRETDAEDKHDATKTNQMIMNRVYNRWVIEFEGESAARRFALSWHRIELPHLPGVDRTWKDNEETRLCNTEVLW